MGAGVSIVIPTWNGLPLLKHFLPSIHEAVRLYADETGSSAEIIVADDGSDDETAKWLLSHGFSEPGPPVESESGSIRFVLVRNDRNAGFGEACNRGFAAARHRLVFLVNNDVEVARDAIGPLVESFTDPTVFAAHCRVFDLESGREVGTGKLGSFSKGFFRVHRSYTATRSGLTLFSMFAGGGSSMFDRDKFLELGGFDRLLAPYYWEDVELSIRAWKRGYSVLYQPSSVVRHRVSSTIRKLPARKVERIQQRNRLIYHWIHLHDRRLMISHVAWVALLILLALISMRAGFVSSFVAAFSRMSSILKRRKREKAAAKRSDRQLLALFETLEAKAEVAAYSDSCDWAGTLHEEAGRQTKAVRS